MDPANAQRFQGPLLYPLSYGGSRASVAPAANTLPARPSRARPRDVEPGQDSNGFKRD